MIARSEHVRPAVPIARGLANWPFVGPTNYYGAMVIDLTATLAFLGLGVRGFAGPPIVACGVVLLGFLSFGLLEYAVHRWILHGPPSIARRVHRHHHAQPTALVATPFFVAAIASIAIWHLVGLVCPAALAALFVFGLYAGYNQFALFHHWVHHHRFEVGGGSHWRRLDRSHHIHHQRQSMNFGVSTTMWDSIFGTFQRDSLESSRRGRSAPDRQRSQRRVSTQP
jgi:cyclopropane-fatty-acyl-phospholipid synthase